MLDIILDFVDKHILAIGIVGVMLIFGTLGMFIAFSDTPNDRQERSTEVCREAYPLVENITAFRSETKIVLCLDIEENKIVGLINKY